MAETVDFSKKANEIESKEEKLGSMELKSGFECAQQDDPHDENWGINSIFYIIVC